MATDDLAKIVSVSYVRQTVADPNLRSFDVATVTFQIGTPSHVVAIQLDMSKYKQEDIVSAGRAELHRLFTRLAGETKDWDRPQA